MKLELGELVQWTDEKTGGYRIGNSVPELSGDDYATVVDRHSKEIFDIPWCLVSPYPSSPIPEPSK